MDIKHANRQKNLSKITTELNLIKKNVTKTVKHNINGKRNCHIKINIRIQLCSLFLFKKKTQMLIIVKSISIDIIYFSLKMQIIFSFD